MSTLVLLRHGQSQWNLENRFTGWFDVDVTEEGAAEAKAAGQALASAGILPDLVHTSLQTRAIKTANLSLRELDRLWVPVRRHWRLNERHYGGLTGLNKAETAEKYGDEQVHIWRRSYDTRPPEMPAGHPDNPNTDPRYANLPPDVLPTTECLKDVVERMLPYWFDVIIPDLANNDVILIAAHGNSLRALVKHLSRIPDEDISSLNIPTGVPLVYEIGADGRPTDAAAVEDRYLR
ncbi:MAG: 2,3-diphosphoglycerate-dependent phosphoglycerate mutase [Acidimicrobiales bacterium]|nr:2,3-diphosphoglycerate-dependent phosphoglycerate mutase [Acidimicrobiales bacterium]